MVESNKVSPKNSQQPPSNSTQKSHAYSATVSEVVNPFNSKGPSGVELDPYFTTSLNPLMSRRLTRKKLDLDSAIGRDSLPVKSLFNSLLEKC
ncbi:hypothetical protein CDAR_192231 [Caerostris darwini]|uniref:Uncharacterized protein n=1 Tax=Caerostris darwini TaxID=1538125 RepID=A0AAV4M4D6_9ARAC|nr:hypothetical protein CDAR_192231 [Caerostris darwini]